METLNDDFELEYHKQKKEGRKGKEKSNVGQAKQDSKKSGQDKPSMSQLDYEALYSSERPHEGRAQANKQQKDNSSNRNQPKKKKRKNNKVLIFEIGLNQFLEEKGLSDFICYKYFT